MLPAHSLLNPYPHSQGITTKRPGALQDDGKYSAGYCYKGRLFRHMNKKDVPQDRGILGNIRVLCYATDENGEYVNSQSAGWEPTNIANGVAWEFINEELTDIARQVKTGAASPLAYHMKKALMDVKLLAQYAGMSAWRVKRHLKPGVFRRLSDKTLRRYATALNLTTDQLKEVPQ